MGNSEVGHLTIGSGRILYQDLQRVNRAVRDGSLFENAALVGAFERARARGGDVHLLGLVSNGGVHSHIDHLRALLELARRLGMEERTWIHAFTDGRDVSPTSAVADLAELPAERIATVVGRYYAMDRDSRWERTERALAAIVVGEGQRASDPVAAVQASYDDGVTDEFVEPVVLSGRPRLTQQDAAIFFNFRPDRARQLSERLLAAGIDLTTMTRYRDDFDAPVAFGEQQVPKTLAETLSRAGAPPAPRGRDREVRARHVLLQRRRRGGVGGGDAHPRAVAARRPELRPQAGDVGARGRAPLRGGDRHGYRFAVVNFANPDMVGHTGSIPAVVAAVEIVDECLGEVVEATHAAGGVCLVTADHGNAEQMLEPDGVSPHTAHTTNPVPLVLTSPDARARAGRRALRSRAYGPVAPRAGDPGRDDRRRRLSDAADPKASIR